MPSALAANYTVGVPTAEPYSKTAPIIQHAGAFSDTFSFDVASTTDSFIWMLPYNQLDISALWAGTHGVQVSLFNSINTQIGTGKTAAQLEARPGARSGSPAQAVRSSLARGLRNVAALQVCTTDGVKLTRS